MAELVEQDNGSSGRLPPQTSSSRRASLQVKMRPPAVHQRQGFSERCEGGAVSARQNISLSERVGADLESIAGDEKSAEHRDHPAAHLKVNGALSRGGGFSATPAIRIVENVVAVATGPVVDKVGIPCTWVVRHEGVGANLTASLQAQRGVARRGAARVRSPHGCLQPAPHQRLPPCTLRGTGSAL